MIIRILAITLALSITGCAYQNRITPSGAVHLPSAEKESVVEEITGSYCFCSQEENLVSPPAYADITLNIGGFDIRRIPNASTITVQRPAWLSKGIANSDKPNYSSNISADSDSSTGECYIVGRKIIYHRPEYLGFVFGIGWFTTTTEFHVNRSGSLYTSNVSSSCGISAFFLVPFCTHEKQTVKMQPLSSDTSCRCKQ